MPYTPQDLRHPSLQTRIEAAAAFREQAAAAVPLLITALDSPEIEAIWRAANTLGHIGDSAAIPALIATGEGAGYEVKLNCVWALGQIGDQAAIPALIEIVHAEASESPDIRYAAALALVQLGHIEVLRQAREQGSEPTQRVAWSALNAAEYLNLL